MFNTFRPVGLRTANAYGWTGYRSNLLDIPGYVQAGPQRSEWLRQNFTYEWFDYSNKLRHESNPPFLSGAAGELLPGLRQPSGMSARILRGFIRRAEHEVGNRASYARLYFMYNPEVIVRDYVSYLDQGALDPFNSVFESKNLVAPPSFLDFSFQLFFDRQAEAQAYDNPGTFVDLEYFDLVVRNIIPRTRATANTLPDSGVMMVNPRDVTVVFSPQITIQGRPLNARVSFEKFTHRMVPVRMRIDLTIRVIYIGPMQDMVEYKAEEFTGSNKVPWNEIKNEHYDFRYFELNVELPPNAEDDKNNEQEDLSAVNKKAREDALQAAKDKTKMANTQFKAGAKWDEIWDYANNASMVWGGYKETSHLEGLGWRNDQYPTVDEMINGWKGANNRKASLEKLDTSEDPKSTYWAKVSNFEKGDLLLRTGSNAKVVFVDDVDIHAYDEGAKGKVKLFMIDSVTKSAQTVTYDVEKSGDRAIVASYNYHAVPTPIAQTVNGPGPTAPADLQAKIDRIRQGKEHPYVVWINGTNGSEYDLLAGPLFLSAGPSPDGPVPGVIQAFDGGGMGRGEFGQLQIDAAISAQKVITKLGRKISPGGCRRTHDEQVTNPNLVGHPANSYHVCGLALDLGAETEECRNLFLAEGWQNGCTFKDCGHHTYLCHG